MSLKRTLLFSAFLSLAPLAVQAGDPVTFQELSLLVRSGQTGQEIVNETARRGGLLQTLTPEQEAALRSQGGSEALIVALRTPSLLAPPDQVAAYNNRHGIHPAAPKAAAPSDLPVAADAKKKGPMYITNHFPPGLEATKKGIPRVMQITDAFRLDELPQAIAKAQSEHKAIGFVMVWGTMFAGKSYSSRLAGSGPGLVHFYEAFKDSMVLVFVRHETELDKVPEAVKQGFNGPDEGGFAPNMAVTDATAKEFIVEIPLGGAKATGEQRDAIFKAGADKIYSWLTYHPTGRTDLPAQ